MAEKKYHNSSIDTMRAFGALAIVMLHVNACWRLNLNGVEAYYGMRTGRALCEAGLMLIGSRWAVPVFFMITGFLLLDPAKDIPLKKNLHYIERMLLVLLIFGYPMCLAERVFHEGVTGGAFARAFGDLVTGNCWGHMWYLYSLVGIYLLLPLLRRFTATATEAEELWVLAVGALCISAAAACAKLGFALTDFGISNTLVGPFYALLGHFLGRSDWTGRIPKLLLYILLALSIAVTGAFEALGFARRDEYDGPCMPWILVFSACLFLLLMQSPSAERTGHHPLIRFLSKHSFCIYLLHPVMLNFLTKYLKIFPDILPAVVGELAFFGAALGFAIACSLVLHCIPGLKKLL